MNALARFLFVALLIAEFICRPQAVHSGRKPAPDLSPLEVVGIQIDGLRQYNEPTPNAGIWTAFQFASPANRQVTGPYGHFLQVLKSPANRPFLDARSARFYDERRNGPSAEVTVELEDQDRVKSRFTFSLSKQGTGPFRDCWMTDGVSRLP